MNQLTRHHLALTVLPASEDSLIVQDLSQYRGWPEFPRLTIYPPNQSDGFAVPFAPNTYNVYHCNQLGGKLGDGVYKLNYSVAPHDQVHICYWFLRTYDLEARLGRWMNRIDWRIEPVDSKHYTTLTRISGLLQAAERVVQDDPDKAVYYYQQASHFISKHHHHDHHRTPWITEID